VVRDRPVGYHSRSGGAGRRSRSGRAGWALFMFGTGWLGVVRVRDGLGVEPSWLGSVSTREGEWGAGGWMALVLGLGFRRLFAFTFASAVHRCGRTKRGGCERGLGGVRGFFDRRRGQGARSPVMGGQRDEEGRLLMGALPFTHRTCWAARFSSLSSSPSSFSAVTERLVTWWAPRRAGESKTPSLGSVSTRERGKGQLGAGGCPVSWRL